MGRAGFRSTRWSLVLQAGHRVEPDAAAVEEWCRTYWYPVYCFIRRQGKAAEDARDLTQEFFCRLLENQWLASVEPGPARFRTWRLVVLGRRGADGSRYRDCLKTVLLAEAGPDADPEVELRECPAALTE